MNQHISIKVATVKLSRFIVTFMLIISGISMPLFSFNDTVSATAVEGKWDQISTGGSFNCATSQGDVYCWGMNRVGQLGDGTTDDRSTPRVVKGLLADKTVTNVEAGSEHSCAIAEGEVYCWGGNDDGRLGNGTNDNSSVPVKVAGLLSGKTVTSVATGWFNSCAVADGEIYCWGYNGYGQLGNGTYDDSSVPVKVGGILSGKSIQQLSVAGAGSCAVAQGDVYCWGDNNSGQLGNGTNDDSTLPVKVAGALTGKSVAGIGATYDSVCAIAATDVYCWGYNSDGQLGDGTTDDSNLPVKVIGLPLNATPLSTSSGEQNACVVYASEAYCWGGNGAGQLGDGTTAASIIPVKIDQTAGPLAGKTITEIDIGEYYYGIHVCAIADGDVYCWGNNEVGEIGREQITLTPNSPVPLPYPGNLAELFDGKAVSKTALEQNLSSAHTCAIADGDVYCWGQNYVGQLGNGTTIDSQGSPVLVGGLLSGKTASGVDVGSAVTCAIAEGDVYCWGQNYQGQIGIGSATAPQTVPVKVDGLLSGLTATAVSVSGDHVCAVADGEIYCWGSNGDGQLGNNSFADQYSPVKVDQDAGSEPIGGKTITAISAGDSSTCAVADGEAYCWGSNSNGRLGSAFGTPVPVKVTQSAGVLQGKTVTSIDINTSHTCAVADGEAYCWGGNYVGQVGDGTTNQSPTPQRVGGALSGKLVTSIGLGGSHTCAVADGEAYCWGGNSSGQVGNGGSAIAEQLTPVKVTQAAGVLMGETILTVQAGGSRSCAFTATETFCWGDNGQSQYFYPTADRQQVPFKLGYVLSAVGTLNAQQTTSISKRPSFSGMAEPGSTVEVTVHSDPVTCTTTADSNGNWSCTLPSDLPPGAHTVNIVVTTPLGDVINLGPYSVTVSGGSTLTGNINAPNTGGGGVQINVYVVIPVLLVLLGLSSLLLRRQR